MSKAKAFINFLVKKPINFLNQQLDTAKGYYYSYTWKNLHKFKILFYKPIPSNKKGIVLFAHFDKDGFIDDYVLQYLKELKKLDVDIIFISNSPFLKKKEINKIKPYIYTIILHWYPGRDFGSWFIGLSLYKDIILKKNFLILCNDSVYGPFHVKNRPDFKTHVKKILETADFGGFTDSWEGKYHIQSYFLIFNKGILESNIFWDFWKNFIFFDEKRKVIEKYEIGLTQYLIKEKFKPKVCCSYNEIISIIQEKFHEYPFKELIKYFPVNPTHFFWDVLIKEMGFPFLKIELIRDNPSKIPFVFLWKKFLEKNTNAPTQLFFNHLIRVYGHKR